MTTSAVGVARDSVPSAKVVEQPQPKAAPVTEQLQPAAAPVSKVLPLVRAKAERLANVERLRVLAMLEIVRYHDHDDRLPLVGGLGLPTFLLLTALFNCTL